MPEKSPYLLLLSACILLIALFPPSQAADANQTVQLVSRERAMSVLAGTNNSIFFVDRQIALAELEKRDLVSAVANLAYARGVFKGAASAFESGDYVKAVGLSSDASLQAQRALVAIPPSQARPPSSSFTWDKASPVVAGANETITFVDERIAEAERARRDVIKPVELLAEARGLFRQASAAFAERDYKSAHELASDATAKAQESLAVLSKVEKNRGILDARSLAIAGAAIALIAAIVYFGPLKKKRSRPKPQAQLIQQYPQPVTSGQRPTYYPQTMKAQYQQQPSPQPTQALRLTAQALRLTAQAQQPVSYYNRQQLQPYYPAQPNLLIQPSPYQQQPQPLQQQQQQRQQQLFPRQRPAMGHPQQQPQAPQPYYYPQLSQYWKPSPPLQKKRQP